MHTTGVVRRIDELGRIVIPKEIRKSLKINNGDSLEILVNDDEILLKKYSYLDKTLVYLKGLVDNFFKIYKKDILITDTEKVIVASKNIESRYLNKNISSNLKELINARIESLTSINILNDSIDNIKTFVVPLLLDSNIMGSIIIISNDLGVFDKDIMHFMRAILIKYIEE